MKRTALLCVALAACQASQPPDRYGFIARLGRDTVSVESVTRRADTLVSDEVDRCPRVRRRQTTIILAADGSIKHLDMDIRTPSEPSAQRVRHVVADGSRDSVHISKTDSTGTRNIAFATGGMLTMAHLPQMYSLTDLYFGAALKKADATRLAAGHSVPLHQPRRARASATPPSRWTTAAHSRAVASCSATSCRSIACGAPAPMRQHSSRRRRRSRSLA